MSLLKLISLIGQGATKGRKMGGNIDNWSRMKTVEKMKHVDESKLRSISIMNVHERNGSRGEGLGMGHRNIKTNKNKL